MSRAAKVCSRGDCPRLQPCPEHQAKPWEGSHRAERTLSGSKQQERARFVIQQHDGICHWCGEAGATVADHVIPLSEDGPDDVENMRPIHEKPCHKEKTAAEAARARARNR